MAALNPLRKTENDSLVIVLSLSFVLGMAVALAVYFAWRLNVGELQAHGFLSAIALIICPPYVLSLVIGPTPDSDLALVLVVGTIVFANAFLYAGVAAGGYFIFTVVARKKVGRRGPSPSRGALAQTFWETNSWKTGNWRLITVTPPVAAASCSAARPVPR